MILALMEARLTDAQTAHAAAYGKFREELQEATVAVRRVTDTLAVEKAARAEVEAAQVALRERLKRHEEPGLYWGERVLSWSTKGLMAGIGLVAAACVADWMTP